MIQQLDFGGFILLRREVLSRYAAAVVRKVREHPQEMGCIRVDELLAGNLDYQDGKRLPREDEAVAGAGVGRKLNPFASTGRAGYHRFRQMNRVLIATGIAWQQQNRQPT